MRAVYFDGNRAAFRSDYPDPGRGSDRSESTVRVTLAGICGTDIEMLQGYMDYRGVMGHEFVGTIIDSDGKYMTGERVAGEINVGCGACSTCTRGLQRHCALRTVLGIQGRDGAFAQMLCLPSENLHRIPDTITDRQAVFIEPLAAAFEIIEQLAPYAATAEISAWRAAVVGDGRLAHLICQVLHTVCGSVTCFGRHREKLDWLENRLGISTKIGIDPRIHAGVFDLVVDASGSRTGFADAVRLVRPRGMLVLKSTIAKGGGGSSETAAADLTQVIIDEVTVVGSRCGLFKPAIDALATGSVSVDHMQGEVFGLAEFGRAVERAQAPDALKVYLDPHIV